MQRKINGYKIQVGENPRNRLRYSEGPLSGRSIVFACGDDAMGLRDMVRAESPGESVYLQATSDLPNVAPTFQTKESI